MVDAGSVKLKHMENSQVRHAVPWLAGKNVSEMTYFVSSGT